MKSLGYTRMSGNGNNFIFIDVGNRDFAKLDKLISFAGSIGQIKCDQIIILRSKLSASALFDAKNKDQVFMQIFNIDGSASEACGNALRCLALLLFKSSQENEIKVSTVAGDHLLLRVKGADNYFCVSIASPKFEWQEIPMSIKCDTSDLTSDLISEIPLPVGVKAKAILAVNLGNPHLTIFVDGGDFNNQGYWYSFCQKTEVSKFFPERVNVGIACKIDDDTLKLIVWERGVGFTKSCGSGACAAIVSSYRAGFTGSSGVCLTEGGELKVSWKDKGQVLLSGAATEHEQGTIIFDDERIIKLKE